MPWRRRRNSQYAVGSWQLAVRSPAQVQGARPPPTRLLHSPTAPQPHSPIAVSHDARDARPSSRRRTRARAGNYGGQLATRNSQPGIGWVVGLEATPGFEPGDKGFAGPCLTTWPRRLNRDGDSSSRAPDGQGTGMPGGGHDAGGNSEIEIRNSKCGIRNSESGMGEWSGRRDLNPRRRPWQGRTLPLSYSRSTGPII